MSYMTDNRISSCLGLGQDQDVKFWIMPEAQHVTLFKIIIIIMNKNMIYLCV